ncbi:hypothetical protein ZIOFF_006368 [Zingiber officinale]|uniref:Poly [ADP-ribose] polymerase n=1 Tax=Zingiber officinale TaxID=94328 RepID=A0A8J5HPP1_ZINOF|nr:hypothetical protein ZIOFF_006368 [Zingiber officinale]
MGYDSPDLPMGMLTDFHLKRGEEELLKFREVIEKASKLSKVEANLLWDDFSCKWFTLMHSTRPYVLRSYQELADHVAAGFEGIRDVNVASRLIGGVFDCATVDDPLSDQYSKLGCSITSVERESEEYEMIVKYLQTTYEPVKVGEVAYGMAVENVFAIQSSAGPSYEEIKTPPNKILLWCGTTTSNLLRHLHKGLLPAVCQIPVPGYMFGRAIVCSNASAEAARYGFTAVDRPDGFLFLGIVSLGEKITEISTVPEDTRKMEEEKVSVKGLGKKRPEESGHFQWGDEIKVPCGRLVASEHKDSPLEFNEYAVYDPKQVCMRFLVAVKTVARRFLLFAGHDEDLDPKHLFTGRDFFCPSRPTATPSPFRDTADHRSLVPALYDHRTFFFVDHLHLPAVLLPRSSPLCGQIFDQKGKDPSLVYPHCTIRISPDTSGHGKVFDEMPKFFISPLFVLATSSATTCCCEYLQGLWASVVAK